jgi:hypothetical protein
MAPQAFDPIRRHPDGLTTPSIYLFAFGGSNSRQLAQL